MLIDDNKSVVLMSWLDSGDDNSVQGTTTVHIPHYYNE